MTGAQAVYAAACISAAILWPSLAAPSQAQQGTRPAQSAPAARIFVVVFDLATEGKGDLGVQLADRIRLRLLRDPGFAAIDQLTTQEASGPLGIKADVKEIRALVARQFPAKFALYGTVGRSGASVKAQVRFIDLRPGADDEGWSAVFTNDTERALGEISKAVVEKFTARAQWKPPEYGQEPEPKNFGKPENSNGDFETGAKGWTGPVDNVSTFIADEPSGRGRILRMKDDLAREPWLEYRRALMQGKASPAKPPKIAADTGYSSVAGLEGCDFVSEYFPARPGQRYWLVADGKGASAAKIFVKGFKRDSSAQDGLSETALSELGLTPEAFARLGEDQRKKLIEKDVAKHPLRYMRECWRWQISCPPSRQWKHWAEPFPPRGGLPKDVEYLQIKILTYWPPGENLWDNVFVYKDPNQKAPLPEERPRTPRPASSSQDARE